MIALWEIFSIMIIHWVGDFILQSDEDAKGKSTNMKNLVSHVFTYSLFWVAPLLVYSIMTNFYDRNNINVLHSAFDFAVITFIFHAITDYFTSRLNAKLWKEEKRHQFFVAIGFDQMLHYAQLFITFYIIYKK